MPLLGAATKQAFTYGKRGRTNRIASVASSDSSNGSDSDDTAPRKPSLVPPSRATKTIGAMRTPPRPRAKAKPLPRSSARPSYQSSRAKEQENRVALAHVSSNVSSAGPAGAIHVAKSKGKARADALLPSPRRMRLDITTLDEDGHPIQEEQKASRLPDDPALMRTVRKRVASMKPRQLGSDGAVPSTLSTNMSHSSGHKPIATVSGSGNRSAAMSASQTPSIAGVTSLRSSDHSKDDYPDIRKARTHSRAKRLVLSSDESEDDAPVPVRTSSSADRARRSSQRAIVTAHASRSAVGKAARASYESDESDIVEVQPPKPPRANGRRKNETAPRHPTPPVEVIVLTDSSSDVLETPRETPAWKTMPAASTIASQSALTNNMGSRSSAPAVPPPRSGSMNKLTTPRRIYTPRRPRRLTPTILHRYGSGPKHPSPAMDSDSSAELDITQELADLDLSTDHDTAYFDDAVPPPVYLRGLLDECGQTTPHEFSAFIETFPFDPVLQSSAGAPASGPKSRKQSASDHTLQFRKIGEASYSEVFGIGDVVLKIVPIRDEDTSAMTTATEQAETPAPSDAADVLREIASTRAMGDISDGGFVRLLRSYIVRGRYPSLLLALWDEYDERKGSESVRPDVFAVSQMYAIIVLPNGGPDLESFTFQHAAKTGWHQACSIFWHVVVALARAEDLVSFEHRDLHWGQILVRYDAPSDASSSAVRAKRTRLGSISMDDPSHGVQVTIIDLGFARMDTGDVKGMRALWTQPDEEMFEGEGEYQYDIYRMMRKHNGDSWEAYRPLTNVMWLHYLAGKLLRAKHLRAPAKPRTTPSGTGSGNFTERECYESLVAVEASLGVILDARLAKPKARSKPTKQVAAGTGPGSASDVLRGAITKGWMREDV